MASTYSNLKIQLMTTGENTGTWGTITNTNLGTALEEAIVGSADVTFSSGNVTLSWSDSNSSQTARNLRLNCTGTTGGSTRNLIVPAIEKVYIVNNGCADSIVVKNATGTGITIPAGATMWIYNNGTDVVDAVNYLTSLTLGTPLAVAQGGTGSNTGVNLASATVYGTLPNSKTTASSADDASAIVARDTGGNFSAGTITANLTGLASNATYAVSAGSATTATTATNATNLVTSNFSIVESGGVLQIKYGSTVLVTIDSSGNINGIANVTAYYGS